MPLSSLSCVYLLLSSIVNKIVGISLGDIQLKSISVYRIEMGPKYIIVTEGM